MKPMTRLLSIAAAAVLSLAAPAVSRAAEGGAAADLEQYFPIRAALASDKLDGVADHATALAKSADKAVAKAAEALARATEIEAARKGFGELSKAVIAEVEKATKAGEKVAVYVFQCSMSKPYGKWLQESDDIGNPYQGSKMLKCGKLIGSTGEKAEKAEKKTGGHDGCGGGAKKPEGSGDGCCPGGGKKGASN